MTTSPYQVMLVDDNDDHCMLIEDMLISTGFARQVVRFPDAESVLSHLLDPGKVLSLSNSLLPDFFLVDIKLPGMSGVELLKQLKANPVTRAVPTIMLTTSEDAEHTRQSYALGASDYVIKPTNHDMLIRKFEKMKSNWDLRNTSSKTTELI